MTGVRAIVFRDTYRGRLIYGRTRWVDKGGTKIKQDVPESEWLQIDAPDLRILPEEVWAAAVAAKRAKRVMRTAQRTRMEFRGWTI